MKLNQAIRALTDVENAGGMYHAIFLDVKQVHLWIKMTYGKSDYWLETHLGRDNVVVKTGMVVDGSYEHAIIDQFPQIEKNMDLLALSIAKCDVNASANAGICAIFSEKIDIAAAALKKQNFKYYHRPKL